MNVVHEMEEDYTENGIPASSATTPTYVVGVVTEDRNLKMLNMLQLHYHPLFSYFVGENCSSHEYFDKDKRRSSSCDPMNCLGLYDGVAAVTKYYPTTTTDIYIYRHFLP